MAVCGEATHADIIAQLAKNNQDEEKLPQDEETMQIQEKPLPSSSGPIVHELQRFFDVCLIQEILFFSCIDRLENML